MPVFAYANCLEPATDAVIWRFMDLCKFRDLMASEELYFRRADLFADKSEGLPPEDYALRVLRLNPYDIRERAELNNHLGSLAQHRESYYINCWHLYRQETLDMWEQYGHDGVAVCSGYGLLKAALHGLLDEAHLGQVHYGVNHLQRSFNALEFITTKRKQYEAEREVRAFLTVYDPLAGGNRHFDLNNIAHPTPLDLNPRHPWVPNFKRRRINLRSVVTDVVISPWAEPDAIAEINTWTTSKGFPAGARPSELTGASTPTLAEFRQFRHIAGARMLEPTIADEVQASNEELDQFQKRAVYAHHISRALLVSTALGRMPVNSREDIPRVADVQFLERTLRILDGRRRQGIIES